MQQVVDRVLSEAKSQGSWWDLDAIEVRRGKHGYGVFAKTDISRGQRLFMFPLKVGIVPFGKIKELCDEGKISNVVALVLTAMHGLYTETKKVPYFQYLSELTPPKIGHCWTEKEKEVLK